MDSDTGYDEKTVEKFEDSISGQSRFTKFNQNKFAQCGIPVASPNDILYDNLPDRVLIDGPSTRDLDPTEEVTMSPDEMEQYRIVNGQDAVPHSWPWQIRARPCSRWRCTYLCGGSIISKSWVVTAAHCIPYGADRGEVTVGEHTIWDPSKNAKNYTISQVVPHADWNRYKKLNDIALLKTRDTIQFNDYIKPICLPDKDICFNPGTACVVTGWGYKSESGPVAEKLQEVAVRILDQNTCKLVTWYSGMVHDSNVCAGYVDGEKDSCAGDSGGPLVCRLGRDMPWVLYGVVSWGYGCARARKPGVYSRVTSFYDWMNNIMNTERDLLGNDLNEEGFIVSGKDYGCATCKDHEIGQCGNSIPSFFATQPPLTPSVDPPATNQPNAEAPPVTTQKPTTFKPTTKAPTTPKLTIKPTPAVVPNSYPCNGEIIYQEGRLTSPNYPKWYSNNAHCEWGPWIKENDKLMTENGVMLINVVYNRLDVKRICYKRGDQLLVLCDGIVYRFCSMMNSKSAHGQLACKTKAKIGFKSDSSSTARGFDIQYKKIPNATFNKCGLPQELTFDSSVNMKREYSIISAHNNILKRGAGQTCVWNLTVEKGKRAVVYLSTNKNFIEGKEYYYKNSKKWVLKCADKLILTSGDGKVSKTVCGYRYFKYPGNNRFVSSDNKIKIELVLNSKTHYRERLFFSTAQYDPKNNKIESA